MALSNNSHLTNKILGKQLRTIRENLKKSIKTVSAETMIPIKSLEKIENGDVKIRELTARKLCRYYNVDFDDLTIQLDTEDKWRK